MNVRRYGVVLYLHVALIVADLFVNTFVDIFRFDNVVQLLLFVLQDAGILCNVIIMFFLLSSTAVFQAGFIWLLLSRFKLTMAMSLSYLALSIAHHVWKLTSTWSTHDQWTSDGIWTPGYLTLYVIQRTVAVLFYYLYNQTVNRIADPRYYQLSSGWIQDQVATKRTSA